MGLEDSAVTLTDYSFCWLFLHVYWTVSLKMTQLTIVDATPLIRSSGMRSVLPMSMGTSEAVETGSRAGMGDDLGTGKEEMPVGGLGDSNMGSLICTLMLS